MEKNDEKKENDVAQDVARAVKNKAINKVKSAIVTKLAIIYAFIFAKLMPIILLVSVIVVVFNWLIELFQGEDTTQIIYASLLNSGVISDKMSQDFTSLVEIKGDEKNGYYLAFKDDADEKFDNVIKELNSTPKTVVPLTKDFLKQMVKAELVTQYPNLGGKAEGVNQFQGAVKIRRITPDKSYGEIKNTSGGETTKQNVTFSGTDTVGQVTDGEKVYKIGIMAAYSTDNPGHRSPTPQNNEKQLSEEELTVKVAKYIEQAFSVYGNIKVVQIGSTEDNPNVSDDGRLQKAKNEEVDALIGIAFNSAGDGTKYENENGISITYNQDGGSDESRKLGNILKEAVSSSMELNKGNSDQTDTTNTLGTKDDSFVSLTINGGYLSSTKDYAIISQDLGLQLYAKGVVNGILEYYNIENKGYGTMIDGTESISSTITSTVVDLKYVPLEQFEKDLTDDPKKALQEFSLDSNFKLITATWSYSGDEITVTKNNTALDYKSIMSKYTMPMEYMLFWYIDTESAEFAYELGQLALNSEFVIMIEDNVTTTRVETTTNEETETKQQDDNGDYSIDVESKSEALHEVDNQVKVTESTSPKIELIYADTWFVKFDNKLLLEQNSKNAKANGTVKESNTTSESTSVNTEEWSETETIKETHVDDDGNEVEEEKEITKNYQKTITTKVTTDTDTVSNEYKAGESEIKGNEQKFVTLFRKSSIKEMLIASWLKDLMENNPKTANMVDITDYLIYKATGIDTGVMSFDFSEYAPSAFNTSTGIYGGTIQEKVWFALRDVGYSEIAVAGAMGNIDYESGGFDPNAIEGGSGEGIGLIQWSFGRKTQLQEYAKSKGVNWSDEDTQVEFLVAEISGQGPAADYSNQRTAGYIREENITSTNEDWSNSTTIDDATLHFMRFFESPSSKASYSSRLGKSKEYYEEFKGKTKPSGSSIDVSDGDGYTSIYKANSGKQFKEYKQYEGSYKDTLYMPYGESISSIGCSITSISIVLTGYGNDVNPGSLAGHNYLANHFTEYGVQCSSGEATADKITEHLKEGKPVVVEISGTLKAGGATKYYGQHFIAVLDINSSGEVYVSDPGSTTTNGWANVDDIVGISKSALYAEN